MSIDFSKFKSLTVAGVALKQLFINGVQVWKSGYKNWVRYSTEADGVTIYNGGLGYKNRYRVRSGGAEASSTHATCTGFIPVSPGDTVRLSAYDVKYVGAENAINVSDASRANLGQIVSNYNNSYGCFAGSGQNWDDVIFEKPSVYKWIVPDGYGIAHIRVTLYTNGLAEDMIVTINEEIA